jgi:hypothetical protein|tara:strand:- start:368 stop:526 length:159 start_codon:yes stop_codon:yes gene_type:complete
MREISQEHAQQLLQHSEKYLESIGLQAMKGSKAHKYGKKILKTMNAIYAKGK